MLSAGIRTPSNVPCTTGEVRDTQTPQFCCIITTPVKHSSRFCSKEKLDTCNNRDFGSAMIGFVFNGSSVGI